MRNSIRKRLILVFIGLAVGPLLIVGTILAWRSFTLFQQQSLLLQQEAAKRVNIQVTAFFQELETELRFTIQTQGLEILSQDPTNVLSDLLAHQPAFDELHLLNSKGQERASVYRVNIAVAAVDRSHSDEFTVPKNTGQIYYGAPFFDESTNEPLITIAVPVVNLRTGSVDGVLVAVTRIKKVWDIIAGIKVSPGQSIYIVDANGKVIAHPNPSVVLRDTTFNVPKQNGIQPGLNGTQGVLAFDTMKLGQEEFKVVAEQTLVQALAPAINIVVITLILIVVAAGIATILSLWNIRQIVQPIQTLVGVAERVSAGDLTVQIQATSNDEIGTLTTTFNSMTTQLRDLVGSLEERVAARTRDMEIVAEVGTATATILESKRLLQEVVDLTKERFNLYHSHIYLLDEKGENLVLTAGAGEPGRVMVSEGRTIPLDREQSLVARAARERKGVTVNDVTQAPDFLPHPLLPGTRSELAVPMIVGGSVIGVFDIQSEKIGRFTESDVNVQTTLAAQLATSIQNVRSFEQTKTQADFESLVNTIGQKIQHTTSIEETLQTAIRELGTAVGASRSQCKHRKE